MWIMLKAACRCGKKKQEILWRREYSFMNTYCDALGIAVPSVEKAAQSRDVCSYTNLKFRRRD